MGTSNLERENEESPKQANGSSNDHKVVEPKEPNEAEKPKLSEDSNGMVVFTYDDSPIEDYTQTFPIHQEYEVPGNSAVNPGLMGSSDRYLSPLELKEMVEAGWGVLSHTYEHRALGEIQLNSPVEPGDVRIYADSNTHARFEEDTIVIYDEESRITAEIADSGSNEEGQFIDLAEPISIGISDDGYTKHPKWKIQKTLDKADDQLEEWGFDVSGFVYPYDRYHGVAEDVVRGHYDAVVNHRWGGGLNEISGLDPTTMQRKYIEEDAATEGEIEDFLDEAVKKDVLAIFGAHSQYESMTEQRTRFAIEAALERDLEIVSLDTAMKITDQLS